MRDLEHGTLQGEPCHPILVVFTINHPQSTTPDWGGISGFGLDKDVFLILEPAYQGSLGELLRQGPVWIVRSPQNDSLINQTQDYRTADGDADGF
jgi:hypothetical protein